MSYETYSQAGVPCNRTPRVPTVQFVPNRNGLRWVCAVSRWYDKLSSSFRERSKRARDRFTRFGVVRVLTAELLLRLERHFGIQIWSIHIRMLSETFTMPPEHAARFEFRLLTLEESLQASQNPALDLSPDFIRAAFDRGDVCFGAYENKNLVAYAWRSLNSAPVANGLWFRVECHPRRYYGYKSLTLDEYRGIRLNGSLIRYSDAYFFERGIKGNISYVALHNLSSRASYSRRPNQKRIGYAGFICWGKRYWTFRTKRVREAMSFEKRAV